MKKLWIFILICGISATTFGQVVNKYTIVLNNDTATLNITVESKTLILNFNTTDVNV